MADGDPEVLPPSDSGQLAPSVTINAYIQLVNKTSAMPEPELLNSYSPDDKEWVKSRSVVEQDKRHQMLDTLIKNDHEITKLNVDNMHRNERHRQAGAIWIIAGALVVTGLLLYLGVGYCALGILAILMAAPLAVGIWGHVLERIEGAGKKEKSE